MERKKFDERVFAFIKLLLRVGEVVSVRKIAKGVGLGNSIRTVHLSINRLLYSGQIRRNGLGKIELSNDKTITRKIPVVSGMNNIGELVVENYIQISNKIVQNYYDYFLFKFKGESMNEISIKNDDMLLIKKTIYVNKGNIVFALVEGEAVLRELQMNQGNIKLVAHSTIEEYEPIFITGHLIIKGIYERNLGAI